MSNEISQFLLGAIAVIGIMIWQRLGDIKTQITSLHNELIWSLLNQRRIRPIHTAIELAVTSSES